LSCRGACPIGARPSPLGTLFDVIQMVEPAKPWSFPGSSLAWRTRLSRETRLCRRRQTLPSRLTEGCGRTRGEVGFLVISSAERYWADCEDELVALPIKSIRFMP